jgi:hypothetical protein
MNGREEEDQMMKQAFGTERVFPASGLHYGRLLRLYESKDTFLRATMGISIHVESYQSVLNSMSNASLFGSSPSANPSCINIAHPCQRTLPAFIKLTTPSGT